MIHDTKNPLECCERCKTAEVGRRAKKRPVVRYTQTAASGQVAVVGAHGLIATLHKDSLFGWYATVAPEFRETLGEFGAEGYERREMLGIVAERYTAAWKRGAVR